MLATRENLFIFVEPGTYFIRYIGRSLPQDVDNIWSDFMLTAQGQALSIPRLPLRRGMMIDGRIAHTLYIAISGRHIDDHPMTANPIRARMARIWLQRREPGEILLDYVMKHTACNVLRHGFPTAIYPLFGLVSIQPVVIPI